ncbi:hypothetical protein ZYGR_0I04020 [Zygosaccharomyces rouxii]|uniref:ZYRO0C09614p n=2 Tax=Zygosaccharomyces rouxii TaxID=4956 RepID=C5DTL9_ZYGRC|nr:uncharacterized protein ZYRO0C09614g [Zygosaccharomyces rouxii]KAH9201691.1 ER membrane protein SH3-domain-containing protein [Zygosaccharomyces rouxii]GAV48105.1 hypothetical protein ZYGR_0I04020 [Zygosaccharomyces rouxii]CAR27130.1 ZYRO0C09614p [Zygosaccharomyces rouxii]
MFTYSDACTVGMGLILSATSFIIGVFYANQAYDYRILFSADSTQSEFDDALKHYQVLHKTPLPVLIGLAAVAVIGLVGHLIRIYKPNPDLRNFEYGSLVLYFFGVCVCLSNVKTGIISSVTGEWGDVSENQGLAVLGSSNIILILFFTGVIMLQGGLWYTRWEHQVRLKQFFQEEAKEDAERKKKAAQQAQESQAHEEALEEDAEKHVKGSLSEKAQEFVEKAKNDPKVQQAEEYYENKIKPTAKKHKEDINNKVRSRRTRRKE